LVCDVLRVPRGEYLAACQARIFHKRYTGADPKCQKLYGPALTECMQTMTKGG